jgi:Ca2+-binding EF-hand superfamily protein
MKKLKKLALGYIASNLTQDQVGYLGEIFNSIDEGGDGVLTLNELDQAIARGVFRELFYNRMDPASSFLTHQVSLMQETSQPKYRTI